jgi:hypothetical protein
MTSLLSTILVGCLIGLSLILLLVSLISYRRTGSLRLLLVGCAFLVFMVKGVLLLAFLLLQSLSESAELLVIVAMDLIIILFLYLAIAKK